MEKIKSVLSGHGKKNNQDETHDTHAASPTGASTTTGSHTEGEAHPIFDQMTGRKGESASASHPTPSETIPSASQTGVSSGLGKTEQAGTAGTAGALGSHSGAHDSTRPTANTLGAGQTNQGVSDASIKSGVIGFEGGERQGHAALPSHNNPAEAALDRNQIVGGGDLASGPTKSDQSGVASQVPHHSGTYTRDETSVAPRSTAQVPSTQQPYETNLDQESYTADTDRSFPLAGGVASKRATGPDTATSGHSNPATSTTTTTTTTSSTHHGTTTGPTTAVHHPTTSSREPGTKEKEVGVHDDAHGREGLAAAAGAAAIAAPLAHSGHKGTQDERLEAQQALSGHQAALAPTTSTAGSSHTAQSAHPEAIAAARAAAAKSSGQDHGGLSAQSGNAGALGGMRPTAERSASRPHIPGEFPSPTPDESRTFLYYREDLVSEPGSNIHLTSGHHGAHDQSVAPIGATTSGTIADRSATATAPTGQHSGTGGTSTTTSTVGPHGSDVLNKADPRVDSNLDGSRTAGSVAGDPSGQHELRHTGRLDEPRPRSSDHEDHTGKNTALAGGLAGAAGLGYAASHKHDHSNVASDTTSPYSSTTLDPRVVDGSGKLDEQRFDPAAKTGDTTHHALQTSNPTGITSTTMAGVAPSTRATGSDSSTAAAASGPVHKSSLLNKLDPRVKEGDSNAPGAGVADTTTSHEKKDSEHHYGRDAALVGGGAATAAGAHHALQRNDTPGTGTTVLPQDSARTMAPLSSSTAPTTQSSAPLSSTTATNTQTAAPVSSVAPITERSTHATTAGAVPAAAPVASTAPITERSTHTTTSPADNANIDTYKGPLTTDGKPFYGTTGAPAPLADDKTTHPHDSVSTSAIKSSDKDHHGRDAALAGGAAAGVGGLAYAGHHDNKTATGPASKTIGPHSSNVANVMDPRVQPDPSKQAHHQAGSTAQDPASRTIGHHDSNIANVVDPRVQPDPLKQRAVHPAADHTDQSGHHYGRDAAIVGGTGAAGYGAYEAAKAYGDHRSTQPGAAMAEQRYDTSASGARAPNPVPTAGHYDYNNAATSRNVNDTTRDHTGRNVALGGATAGALGGAAYAGSKHGDHTQQSPTTASQPLSGLSQPAGLAASQPAHGTTGQTAAGHGIGHHDKSQDHTGRNVALGGATAGALGGAAYAGTRHGEHSQQVPTSASQPLSGAAHPAGSTHSQPTYGTTGQPATGPYGTQGTAPGIAHNRYDSIQDPETDHTKRNAALAGAGGVAAAGGAYAYSQHDADKERERLEKEQKKLDKEHDKEQKKLDKEHVKDEKKHHKEEEKEAARHEKEREGEPEKKHGILGFLHRDKTKKEKRSSNDSSPRQSGEIHRPSESPGHSKEYAAGGLAAGAGAGAIAAHEHESNDPNSPRWKGKNRLQKDPPMGHPTREAHDHRDDSELTGGKREHIGVDGEIGRPDAISGYTETRAGVYGAQPLNEIPENNKVIEPHTGLPMNIGRFGEGVGGTDGSSTVVGHHAIPGVDENLRTGHGTTDWEDVKKKDTLF